MLHIFLIAVFSIWMTKLAEIYKQKKGFAILLGAGCYVGFALGIHFLLFLFDDNIYDPENFRLVNFINVASGVIGIGVASLIVVIVGSRK